MGGAKICHAGISSACDAGVVGSVGSVGSFVSLISSIFVSNLILLLDAQLASAQQRPQTCKLFSLLAQLLDRIGVTERLLEVEPKERFLDLSDALDEVVARLLVSSCRVRLHSAPPLSCSLRVTNLVLIGSFAAASLIASCAVA